MSFQFQELYVYLLVHSSGSLQACEVFSSLPLRPQRSDETNGGINVKNRWGT